MMLLIWTAILYNDDPTVLVLTEAAFLLVTATVVLEASISTSWNYDLHGFGLTYLAWHVRKGSRRSVTRSCISPISHVGT